MRALRVHAAPLAGPAAKTKAACRHPHRPAARQRLHVAALAAGDPETVELSTASSSAAAAPASKHDDAHAASLAALHQSAAARGRRVAVLQATKKDSIQVEELSRPLAEYMALPASQYSVLDARRVERLDGGTFRCHVGAFRFFSFSVEPVITVSVELQGSPIVEQANDRFDATMTNAVEWRGCELDAGGATAGGCSSIASETTLRVALEVPGWFVVPTAAIESTGSKVMAKVLGSAVPRFLAQLARDYELWANGDDSRKPISDSLLPEDGEEEEEDGFQDGQSGQQDLGKE